MRPSQTHLTSPLNVEQIPSPPLPPFPTAQFLSVRLHIINLLPQVTVLNEVPVSAKEKVLSNNMHGADAEALRAIRRK